MKQASLFFVLICAFSTVKANSEITPNDPIPKVVLQCGGAKIAKVGPRFDGDPASGSSVTFNNGEGVVSYDVVPAIRDSRVGDHLLVCLVYVPKDCPPGDSRGKEYTVTNLRTLQSWTLPNSQHGCGGA